jgi:hypothetical protein
MRDASGRESVMNEAKHEFELNEEKLFFNDVQDEALEAVGDSAGNAMAYTLAMCTGNAECPF